MIKKLLQQEMLYKTMLTKEITFNQQTIFLLISTKLQSIKVSITEFHKTIMLLRGTTMGGIDKYYSIPVHSTWYESMVVLSNRSRTYNIV